jgi:hypothetical protein
MNKSILLLSIFLLFLCSTAWPKSLDRVVQVVNRHPSCLTIQPFYLEIGNRDEVLLSRSIGSSFPERTTKLPIASASKWIFAAYVLESIHQDLNAQHIQFLTMRSGYTQFQVEACINNNLSTVAECAQFGRNGDLVQEHIDRFFYNNGHYQVLALELGLGPLNGSQLAQELINRLNLPALSFNSIQLGGGITMSAEDYAPFLQSLLNLDLLMGENLGSFRTCTYGPQCSSAIYSPVELPDEYSLGHWVESSVDGAYSSAGFFGFYPWIDKEKTHYGIISRFSVDLSDGIGYGPGFTSMLCGQAIRQALKEAQR